MKLSHTDFALALDTNITADQVRDIATLSGGWIGPARLLARWLHDGGTLDHDGLFIHRSLVGAYIEDEILNNLPVHWNNVLYALGTTDTFDASLIAGFDLPDLTIATLECRLGALLSIAEDGKSYRLNPLLARAFRVGFDALPVEKSQSLRLRVAEWALGRGDVLTAARLAMINPSEGDLRRYILRADGLRLWLTRGYDDVRAFVEIAGPLIDTEPRLKLLHCVVLLKDGAAGAADRLYSEAIKALPSDPGARRDAALVHATLLVYGCRPVTESDNDAFRQIAEYDRDPAWRTMLPTLLAVRYAQQADFGQATASIAEARAHAQTAGIAYNLMFLDMHDAVIALAQASHTAARGALELARRRWRSRFKADRGAETVIAALSAQLAFEQGKWAEAGRHVRKSGHRLPGSEAWLDIYVAAFEPMIRLQTMNAGCSTALAALGHIDRRLRAQSLDRIADILAWLATCIVGEERLHGSIPVQPDTGRFTRPASSAATWQEVEFAGMAEAYDALMRGRHGEAQRTLDALIDYAAPRTLRRTAIRALLLKTAACDGAGMGDAADNCFAAALKIGLETGLSAAFRLIGGPAVERRVAAAIQNSDPVTASFLSKLPVSRRSSDAIRLTRREQQMLAELRQGGSDKEIARRIGISDHAVRFHLKGLFRKLGVHDRIAAVRHSYETNQAKTS